MGKARRFGFSLLSEEYDYGESDRYKTIILIITSKMQPLNGWIDDLSIYAHSAVSLITNHAR